MLWKGEMNELEPLPDSGPAMTQVCLGRSLPFAGDLLSPRKVERHRVLLRPKEPKGAHPWLQVYGQTRLQHVVVSDQVEIT